MAWARASTMPFSFSEGLVPVWVGGWVGGGVGWEEENEAVRTRCCMLGDGWVGGWVGGWVREERASYLLKKEEEEEEEEDDA